MSIRNLDALLSPKSVALIGASKRPGSVGATVWANLRSGGFQGPVWPVNPKYRELDGVRCYADVAALPEAPELAVICTPASTVLGVLAELAARGNRAVVVMTAGLTADDKLKALRQARPTVQRILGPNCIGLLAPHAGLNASFAHVPAQPGGLAFVSQSGALVTAMLDWAAARAIGFSSVLSLGEHADVDFGDVLDYLASDAKTRSILLYVESITHARKFMSAARAAARNKPVLVVKAGRSAAGQQAAASHTGALAGADAVYDAALARAGTLRVDTLDDLFLAAETLTRLRGHGVRQTQGRVTVVTNGGGAGVMAADAAARAGLTLPPLSDATRSALDAVLPVHWSRANPIDLIGDAPVERYVATFQALMQDPEAGDLLFIHAPTAIVPSLDIARALVPVLQPGGAGQHAQAPRVLACWLGAEGVAAARTHFQQAGIATYATPEDAVRACALLNDYARNQEDLLQTPSVVVPPADPQAPSVAEARAVVATALAEGRELLNELEAKTVLAAWGIPVVPTRRVDPTPQAAAEAATSLGFPAVLKILSPAISHKSDVGGVALDLHSAAAVARAAEAMLARVRQVRPDAVVEGFTVQPMVRRAHARELIVGASVDAVFGPIVLFGQGGTSVEVVADRAVALPPLNSALAASLIERTRVARLLKAWRDVPAADLPAVQAVLMAVSQMLVDLPELAELDINPLLAAPDGVVALDARVRVSAERPAGPEHFAIRPYPVELVSQHTLRDGRPVTLRPIRPEDEPQHRRFLEQLDPEDIRLRIFYSRRSIEHSELARLTQIDYDRELAFIAEGRDADGQPETLGAARATADPDNQHAEFGIIIRSDLKGQGIGGLLMRALIEAFRARGTQQLVAWVLKENDEMLGFMRHLGFAVAPAEAGDDMRWVSLDLQTPAPSAAARG